MTADATKEREFWLKLILWVQAEARGERIDPTDGKRFAFATPVTQFQAQRWLTTLDPVITRDVLLVCEYAGIEKEDALKLRQQMRSLYGVVGGRGWRIARDQDAKDGRQNNR